jgi:hypothetical protein
MQSSLFDLIPEEPVARRKGYQIWAYLDDIAEATYVEATSIEELSSREMAEFPVTEGYTDHGHSETRE